MTESLTGPTAIGTEHPRVLVVEDADNIALLVQRGLLRNGFEVEHAPDGRRALIAARSNPPDLIVLDLGLPAVDGLEVCRRIRAADDAEGRAPTPILMLTARDAVRDRVTGLDAGADDYLGKPFSIDELVARLRALHRRARATAPLHERAHELRFADVVVNPRRGVARRGDRRLDLSTRELALLVDFLRHPNQVLTPDEILQRVWGVDYLPESNVLAVTVAALRRELEADGAPRLIQTIRNLGYVLRSEEELS